VSVNSVTSAKSHMQKNGVLMHHKMNQAPKFLYPRTLGGYGFSESIIGCFSYLRTLDGKSVRHEG
jgi:hypothetical protein